MNTLIIGAGAVGIAIGTSLSTEESRVDFLTSENTKNIIDKEGIMRTGIFGEIKCKPGENSSFSEYGDLPENTYDFIVVCVKTMANIETARNIYEAEKCIKPDGKIIIIQNGWGNEEEYLKYFSEEKVFNARISTGFIKTAPNVSEITVYAAPLLIGSIKGCDNRSLKPLVDVLNASGIKSELTDQIEEALWAKMLYNTSLNPLGAILKVPYGKLIDSENSKAIMSDLIDETFGVMKAAGYRTFWDNAEDYKELFFGKLVPETREHRSSTFQDIENRRKTEIETLSGTVIKLGDRFGVEVNTHRLMYRLVRTLEEWYQTT